MISPEASSLISSPELLAMYKLSSPSFPIKCPSPKSILFAPLKHFDSSKEFYDIYESYVLGKGGVVRRTPSFGTNKYSFFKDKDLTELIFHRSKSVLESENWKEFLEERESA